MRHWFLGLFFLVAYLPAALLPGNVTIKKIGEWGTGDYGHVALKGDYAFCTASGAGLDIIDIENPQNPVKVANCDTPGKPRRVYVRGDYAYVADYEGGLQIIDISNPLAPVSVLTPGYVPLGNDTVDVCVRRNYAYVVDSSKGLQIIDISTPSSPTLAGQYDELRNAAAVYVKDNYAYVAYMGTGYDFSNFRIIDISNPSSPTLVADYIASKYYYQSRVAVSGNYAYVACTNVETPDHRGSLLIIDVSNPASPVLAGHYETSASASKDVVVNGNYVYLANVEGGIDVINISNPSSPTLTGSYDTPGQAYGVAVDGNNVYVADQEKGLRVVDVSTPSSPAFAGAYNASGAIEGIYIKGNYAYIAKGANGLYILDISTPSSPTPVSVYETPYYARKPFVKGRYAYVACGGYLPNEHKNAGGVLILDVPDPASPTLVTFADAGDIVRDVYVKGNYAYTAGSDHGLLVIDISNLSAPSVVANFGNYGWVFNVYVQDNYAYALGMDFYLDNILMVFDISNPTSLPLPGYLYEGDYTNFNGLYDVFVKGNYAYIAGYSGLHIVDISNPASPSPSGHLKDVEGKSVFVEGDYAYFGDREHGLSVLNISNPTLPTLDGQYDSPGNGTDVFGDGKYIYLADGNSGKLFILEPEISTVSPQIVLNRSEILFDSNAQGIVSGSQSFLIDNGGGGTLNWSVSSDSDWLHCSPVSGTGSGKVTVSVDITGLATNSYWGTVTVSDPGAWNSPQTLAVTLSVSHTGSSFDPVGEFDTPVDGSVVRGSIPVTGWALDDIGVRRVQIYRGEEKPSVYIGDAVFVEGARPDVALLYSYYPNSYNAGWGYMLLTNFLPGGGNGTFKLHAVAEDLEGHRVTLGTRTITCDNANAKKPFGALDTPAPGDTVSGNPYVNYGWALTPLPNTIPLDGSTIRVWVDGVPLGSPVYNLYREDISSLFPGYNNSGGAAGYFNLDTTPYTNGVHIIQWTVEDDGGNSEGIGSRYFNVLNAGGTAAREVRKAMNGKPLTEIPVDSVEPVCVLRGYESNAEPEPIYPDEGGRIIIEMRELERLELHLPFDASSGGHTGCMVVGNQLRPLPIGSTFDPEKGIFYWQAGPGFVGEYRLRFFGLSRGGEITSKDVIVRIYGLL